ncbi:MAG: CHAP domain-containing protein [Lachnospiraceae bacterium]|nr:CHAP domain-containing protein [Lachnospiraceae bacterium]
MAFTPLTSSQPISYASSRSSYRNSARETLAGGSPVFFNPSNYSLNQTGYPGPRYKYGYTYNNCPAPENTCNGNCTWWCWGRLNQTMGTSLPNMGDGKDWYDNYSGVKYRNANNIQPGDIIVFTDNDAGHVMFVEKVDGNTITISQSAYSTRSVWSGMACLVTTFSKSDIYQGNSINMYKDLDSAYYQEVVGVIHTGEDGPGPTPEPVEPEISIIPSSYSVTMGSEEDYVDFPFDIIIAGIPTGESASGGNTYPGLIRVANTGWSYTSYVVDGVTYRRATKSQTLRYERESEGEYVTTKHMYFNMTFSNGSINTDTPMTITVEKKKAKGILMLEWDGGNVQIL